MKTDRKTIVLMGAVLIACMCVCMATKEGLEKEDPCSFFVPMDIYDPNKEYKCEGCSDGDNILKRQEKNLGKINIMHFTCGKASG